MKETLFQIDLKDYRISKTFLTFASFRLCGKIKKMKTEIVHIANNSFALAATETDLLQLLADKINYLIVNDFNKLISILYRADINETKLNIILSENRNEDAGKLIALLFIERQKIGRASCRERV